MRWVHRFPSGPTVSAQERWVVTRWGTFDLGWAVDEVVLVPLLERWALLGRWNDGEPVVDLIEDVEFDTDDDAIGFALRAGWPVRNEHGLLALPLPPSPEQAAWRRKVRLDHLAERLRTVDGLIEQHPHNLALLTLREALTQRWRQAQGPRLRLPRRERTERPG